MIKMKTKVQWEDWKEIHLEMGRASSYIAYPNNLYIPKIMEEKLDSKNAFERSKT